ncbi:hypothetical protein KAT82_04995 [bacterium]|nr:hypothetical protein [bacterium]
MLLTTAGKGRPELGSCGVRRRQSTLEGSTCNRNEIKRGRAPAAELARVLRELSDADVGELLSGGTLDALVRAIFDPIDVKGFPTYADFFLGSESAETER